MIDHLRRLEVTVVLAENACAESQVAANEA